MSGTSMDGIDAALLATDGVALIDELANDAYHYTDIFHLLLKAAEFAVFECGGDCLQADVKFQVLLDRFLKSKLNLNDAQVLSTVDQMKAYLAEYHLKSLTLYSIIKVSTLLHVELIEKLLKKNNLKKNQIDVIGYHGQTLYHNPRKRMSVQVGDGVLLAKLTGIKVVNNFRQNDIDKGGQGAPLAPIYHQALAIRDKRLPLAVVNCGGISNITLIDGEKLTDLIAYDCGPGNGLLDRYLRLKTQGEVRMDLDGHYSKQGRVNEEVMKQLYQKSCLVDNLNYYDLKSPKSLDLNDLQLVPELETLSVEDACMTLASFTVHCIIDSLKFLEPRPPKHWQLCGGGWKNPSILNAFKQQAFKVLGEPIHIDDTTWDTAALEAQAFAFLAVRRLYELPISAPGTTGVAMALTGGDISSLD